LSAPTFRPSHRALLAPLEPAAWPGAEAYPEAVVVPTARPASHPRSGIAFAARLASATRSPLVLLVSKDAATRASLTALEWAVKEATGGDPPPTLMLHLSATPTRRTHFDVDDLEISRAYRRGGGTGRLGVNDVGRKRNALLLFARSMRWRTLLFLDDDVFEDVDGHGVPRPPHPRPLDPAGLAAATGAVRSRRHAAVGWTLRDFDDNSVLCRIRAAVGDAQDQFVGGGALLVDVEADLPFFPAIYNEDWLFLLRVLTSGPEQPVLDGGDVHQDPYEPFPAARAAAEEIGDLIGEGLLSLLQGGGPGALGRTTAGFWQEALRVRTALREDLERRVDDLGGTRRREMRGALDAVKVIHERFLHEEDAWIDQIRTFLEVWQRDLGAWRHRLYRDTAPRPRAFLDCGEFAPARSSVLGPVADVDAFVAAFAC
jgi:hypothetical protein